MNRKPTGRESEFDALYASMPDPWAYETSPYEKHKRAATIAALSGKTYRRAFEAGCSIGVLTKQLAPRCESLIAMDVSGAALEQASQRLAGNDHVALYRGEMPYQWPEGTFDLILLSEVLYFLSASEIEATARLCYRSLREGGDCLLVNWTGKNDLPVDGDQASRLFFDSCPWNRSLEWSEQRYRIDLFRTAQRLGEPQAVGDRPHRYASAK